MNDAVATQPPVDPNIPPKEFGALLKELAVNYFRHFLHFAVIVAIFEIALIEVILLIDRTTEIVHKVGHLTITTHHMSLWTAFLILLVYEFFYMIILSILIRTAASYIFNGSCNIPHMVLFGWKRLVNLGGMFLQLMFLGLGLGFILIILSIMHVFGFIIFMVFILPFLIYLTVKWGFIFQAVAVEGRGPGASFSRSSELVRDRWWRTFGILLVIGIISGGIGIGLYYAFHFLGVYSQLISAVITVPISIIGSTLLYYDLRARNEDFNMKQAIAELDSGFKPVNNNELPF